MKNGQRVLVWSTNIGVGKGTVIENYIDADKLTFCINRAKWDA